MSVGIGSSDATVEAVLAATGGDPERSDVAGDLKRTARITGAWYLALGIFGMLSFLVIRPQIHVAGDPAATLDNVVGNEGLAQIGVALELAVVASQAMVAVWFYKLFRSMNPTAAWAVAAFGMVNAAVILVSAACMATALSVVADAGLAPGTDTAATVQLMYQLSENAWGVGALFFGLWLIPMGHVAATCGRMPVWLGRILMIGGVGYVLSAFLGQAVVAAPSWLAEGLVVPATIGEFWMIGYLLFVGIRPSSR